MLCLCEGAAAEVQERNILSLMPRIRSIKHEFFVNEELAGLSAMARLLFIGLWTIADKAGRLEDRPQKIKGQIFPHENADVDALLNELQTLDVLDRYIVDGKGYLQVTNFTKHQKPHPKEPESILPTPASRGKTRASREKKLPAVKSPESPSMQDESSARSFNGNGNGLRNGIPGADAPKSDHSILMQFLFERFGKIPDAKAQAGAVKWLLDSGYAVPECESCLDDLASQAWRDTRISWLTVKNEIGTWKVRGKAPPRANGVDIGMQCYAKAKAEEERDEQERSN